MYCFTRVLFPKGNSLTHYSDNICIHLAKNVHKAPYGFTSLSDLAQYLSLPVCMWPTAPKTKMKGIKTPWSLLVHRSWIKIKHLQTFTKLNRCLECFSEQKLSLNFTVNITGSNMCRKRLKFMRRVFQQCLEDVRGENWKGPISYRHVWSPRGGEDETQTWRHPFRLEYCDAAQRVSRESCQQQPAHSKSSVENKEGNAGSTESVKLLSVWSLIMDLSHVRHKHIWHTSPPFISDRLFSYYGRHAVIHIMITVDAHGMLLVLDSFIYLFIEP